MAERARSGPWLLAGVGLVLLVLLGWWLPRSAAPRAALESPAAASLLEPQGAPAAVPSAPAPLHSAASAPAPPPLVADADATSAEQTLRELERLSRVDKPGALALALVRDRELPEHGVQAEARRALIVTLLVDTRHMPEARKHAAEFRLSYPKSRYLSLVEGVTGMPVRPRPSALVDARQGRE